MISFHCGCGFTYEGESFEEEDKLHDAFRLMYDDACCNCSSRKCMSCVFREQHDECVADCPFCCRSWYREGL